MSMDASAAIAAALRALQAQAKESSEHLDAIDPLLGECKAAVMSPSLQRALAPAWKEDFMQSISDPPLRKPRVGWNENNARENNARGKTRGN